MCHKEIITINQFWQSVQKTNHGIEYADALWFFQTYDIYTDYQFFLEKALRDKRLPFALVLDLVTAYQFALADIGEIAPAEALEAAEWNKVLKLCEEKIGADKFDINTHGNPRFIFKNIINSKDFDKIVENCYAG
ncbi:MAG: hypothetical protein LH472_04800 [Pyrinomonadaceae bacterium]|nr:hypothetical protein [Pyrinomonadaceae bacterium]